MRARRAAKRAARSVGACVADDEDADGGTGVVDMGAGDSASAADWDWSGTSFSSACAASANRRLDDSASSSRLGEPLRFRGVGIVDASGSYLAAVLIVTVVCAVVLASCLSQLYCVEVQKGRGQARCERGRALWLDVCLRQMDSLSIAGLQFHRRVAFVVLQSRCALMLLHTHCFRILLDRLFQP